VLLLVFGGGCIATGQYKYLAPDAPGATREAGFQNFQVIRRGGAPDQIRLHPQPGLALLVRACNREEVRAVTVAPFIPIIPWPPSIYWALTTAPEPPLVISMSFAEGVGYTFDPTRVTVRLAQDRFTASAYAARSGTDVCTFDANGPLPAQPLAIRGALTIALQFDIPVIPVEPLLLEIGGLQAGTTAVEIAPVTFHRDSQWIFYWLNR
jgi:hypothetical protein